MPPRGLKMPPRRPKRPPRRAQEAPRRRKDTFLVRFGRPYGDKLAPKSHPESPFCENSLKAQNYYFCSTRGLFHVFDLSKSHQPSGLGWFSLVYLVSALFFSTLLVSTPLGGDLSPPPTPSQGPGGGGPRPIRASHCDFFANLAPFIFSSFFRCLF